jgi:hypothetical protein
MPENASNLHCSPYNHIKYAITDSTCYSHSDLKLIAKEYNKLTGYKIPTTLDKTNLYNTIKEQLSKECKTEYCWMKKIQNSTVQEKLKKAFRPEKPVEWYKNKKTWLNTYDILYVMDQYEKLYQNFKFLGVYPIDFTQKNDYGSCIGDMMCDFHINNLGNKHNRFGLVLNLDKHNEPGSHWVAIYCNLNPKKENYGIYYYDSVASSPNKKVLEFMNKIKTQTGNNKFQVKYNRIQKQFQNTECGMFSIIFLTQCLKHVPFKYICKYMRSDEEINRIRDIIYTPLEKQL